MKKICTKIRSFSVTALLKKKYQQAKEKVLSGLDHHIENCPRCRKRLRLENRVEIALMLIKTRPYKMGLLGKANEKALNMLSHKLRYAPRAEALRKSKSDISRLEKIYPLVEPFINATACLLILFMIKTGTCRSIESCREKGTQTIENYYANRLNDADLFDEIFPENGNSLS